jgi:hypothetical protein
MKGMNRREFFKVSLMAGASSLVAARLAAEGVDASAAVEAGARNWRRMARRRLSSATRTSVILSKVTRYVRTWGDCAAVETWAEIRHSEPGPVRLVRADSFSAPVAVTSDVVRVLSLTGIAKNEANDARLRQVEAQQREFEAKE